MLKRLIERLRLRHYQVRAASLADGVMLTYLCTNAVKASGGTKVIYHHVSLINKMASNGVKAQIFHAKKPAFRCQWQFPALAFKPDFIFEPARELYVIHEMWAAREAPLVHSRGIPYAIFVQNGYYIQRKATLDSAAFAYAHAQFILSVSQDIHDCLNFLFPQHAHKVIRLPVSVDATLFAPAVLKKNIITYMPRKLKKHADLVLFFLRQHLPAHWQIQAIDRMDASQVAACMADSKIFMSFSELEGLGLPPIEAALAGNLVIGYTGQGGKEYWQKPLFTEVANGDIVGYAQAVLDAVQAWDHGQVDVQTLQTSRTHLAEQYALANEVRALQALTETVAARFGSKNT